MDTTTDLPGSPVRSIRRRVLGFVIALALMFALVPAAPAGAHTSTYCGHASRQEFTGNAIYMVEYWNYQNTTHDGRQVHFHIYIHHVFNGYWGWVAVHDAKRHCGTWH